MAPVADSSRRTPSSLRPVLSTPSATVVVVAAITLLGAVLRFWRIGHQGYWYDESITVSLLHHSFGGMLSALPHSEGTPPLYYCIAWVWARVFGFGEAGVRSLSAVAGILTVPAMYAVGAKLITRRGGTVAAALAATSPFLIWYGQEARSYSLLVLLATLSLLAFTHVLGPRPSGRWLAAWAVAAALTLTTHYFGVLAVAPQALWLLWVHRRDRGVWLAVAAVAVVAGALLPLALSQRTNTAWIAAAPLSVRLDQIAPQFVLGTGTPARVWLKLAGALAILAAVGLLVVRADAGERRGAVIAGGLTAAGFALALLLIPAGFDELITRNVIVLLITLIVVVAAGLGARRAGLLGLTGAATLCAIGVIATIAVSVDWQLQRPAWGAVVRAIESSAPPHAGTAIVVENDPSFQPLSDYIPRLSVVFGPGVFVQEINVVAAVKGPPDHFCWWGAACHLPLAPLATSFRLAGFEPDGPIVHVNQFSILRLRAASPVRVSRDAVARALQGTPLRSFGLFVRWPR